MTAATSEDCWEGDNTSDVGDPWDSDDISAADYRMDLLSSNGVHGQQAAERFSEPRATPSPVLHKEVVCRSGKSEFP
jgi:hypothetical protein